MTKKNLYSGNLKSKFFLCIELSDKSTIIQRQTQGAIGTLLPICFSQYLIAITGCKLTALDLCLKELLFCEIKSVSDQFIPIFG